MTDQQPDKEFDAFLAGESELADRYAELGREEPPPELDALILAEARNAAKVRRLNFGPRGGWLKPVALAATVLLSLSLVINIVVDSPLRYEQVVTESTKPDIRPEAESAMQALRSPAGKKRMTSNQPAASGDRDREMMVEEITVVARKTPTKAFDEPAQATQPGKATAPDIDRAAALLIVAGYVAAIDSGRVEADTLESEFMPKAEQARSTLAGSAAVDQVTAAGDERQPEEDLEDGPENNPDALLRNIERLNVSGASAEADALLDAFLMRYPDHPVSVKIHQLDY